MFLIDIYEEKPDEKTQLGVDGRRCYETRMTFLSHEKSFLRSEKRGYHTFIHCHDMEPSFEELKRLMERNVPMHPLPQHMSIVDHKELTRHEYLDRF
jgi:hypothetical protein